MSALENPKGRRRARASAVVRLCSAREELWRAANRHAEAHGTPAESWTVRCKGEAAAELATREEWLHWIDRGTSIRPEADGEWARQQEQGDARQAGGMGQATALLGPRVVRDPRRPQLWSDSNH